MKKPDNVVFNEKTKTYDAALKPYGTNLSAPSIKTTDTIAWKNKGIAKLNHNIERRYQELKKQYNLLMEEIEHNNLVYSSKFTFEPIIGEVYYLYERDNGETFLSILSPDQCDFNSLGSFLINSDYLWEKIV